MKLVDNIDKPNVHLGTTTTSTRDEIGLEVQYVAIVLDITSPRMCKLSREERGFREGGKNFSGNIKFSKNDEVCEYFLCRTNVY